MDISVVLPAYQEAENLKNIIPSIKTALEKFDGIYEILVIDTIEPMDNSKNICLSENVRYINRKGGNSYGDAIRTGFAEAMGKYIVVMDADGSHNPKEILNMYHWLENDNYDLVIGSRYCKGGNTENNFALKFMSWALNITYRVLFNLKVKDVSDSYRMYKREQVSIIDLECDNFDIVEEVLIKINHMYKANIKEIPITFNKRVAGESKRDLLKFVFSYFTTIKRLLKMKNKANSKK